MNELDDAVESIVQRSSSHFIELNTHTIWGRVSSLTNLDATLSQVQASLNRLKRAGKVRSRAQREFGHQQTFYLHADSASRRVSHG